MHNRDVDSGLFTLAAEPLIHFVKGPFFDADKMIDHPALTEEQEWSIRLDMARLKIRRERMINVFARK